jgi:glycosyltransferase involved in cell wall biosynthesis
MFSAVYALLLVSMFPRLVVHHRTFGYIMKPSRSMAILVRSAPKKIVHIFHDRMMKEQFQARYGSDSPCLMVANAATCDVEVVESFVRPDRPITIGFLSNLVEDKGFDVVEDAFPKLKLRFGKDIRFSLAGRPIGPTNEARLLRLQETLGAQLEYHGEVFGESKKAFFLGCDIFLFPTRYHQESSGNVLYEAMAAGAAIVSTQWVGVPCVLEGTASRLIRAAPDSGDELVKAVADIIQSGDLQTARAHQIACFRSKKAEADVQYARLLTLLAGGKV